MLTVWVGRACASLCVPTSHPVLTARFKQPLQEGVLDSTSCPILPWERLPLSLYPALPKNVTGRGRSQLF